jgi:hypothetical protein
VPTVVRWHRLEGRPRAHDFSRALRAEVRDALWMLSRQWQLGEFLGDDAGSPLGAQIHLETGHINRLDVDGHGEPYDDDTPLEARVERQPIAFTRGGAKLQLDLRLQLGRQWSKLLGAAGLGDYVPAYRAQYPFALPPQDRSAIAAGVYAHLESSQELAAIAGRRIDGGDLYLATAAGTPASQGIALSDPSHGARLDALGNTLVAWFDALYYQPGKAPSAWRPAQLEHAFQCTAPIGAIDKTLIADQYPGGHLDWCSFDVTSNSLAPVNAQARRAPFQHTFVSSFLPAPIQFDGMPHTRWWKLEDNKVSFGKLTPSTTDIGKLLLVEFALVYANDWFVLPFRLPAGSLANIRGMTVTNSFNERFWIDAAGSGPANAWQSWRMFTLSTRTGAQADLTMFLAPTVPKIQDGKPLDDVFLVRDEIANMVWGIETTVPLVTGASRRGAEAARDTLAYHRRLVGAEANELPYQAPIYYQAMTTVPEHWIPFVPVHVEGSNREIQLQRGRILRLIEGDPLPKPATIEPATPTLRHGLDQAQPDCYYIHEQEVPRSGTRISRAFQRTRWRNGRTFVWLGMRKTTGRGEDRSNLAFDQIASKPPRTVG